MFSSSWKMQVELSAAPHTTRLCLVFVVWVYTESMWRSCVEQRSKDETHFPLALTGRWMGAFVFPVRSHVEVTGLFLWRPSSQKLLCGIVSGPPHSRDYRTSCFTKHSYLRWQGHQPRFLKAELYQEWSRVIVLAQRPFCSGKKALCAIG
jgi:hypothetical protein